MRRVSKSPISSSWEVVSIKKRQTKAYILLESLMAIALLSILATVVLGEIVNSRAEIARQNRQIEVLNVGLMAFDSGQSTLTANQVTVNLTKTRKKIVLESSGQEVLTLEILQETP
jgi:type II secretory pathway pseudopilin PulG